MGHPTSRRMREIGRDYRALFAFLTGSAWARKQGQPDICDFVVGNPHELPVPEFRDALARAAVPRDPGWFAYVLSDPAAVAAVRATVRRTHGIDVAAEDVVMTSGAFAGLAAVVRATADAGDEVMFTVPTWFFYDPIIRSMGAEPVRVPVRPDDWDLDVDAIAAAITPRTRAVIVNTPNNPSGRIYPRATLDRLADVLVDASERHGRTIHVIADESYHRIVYSGIEFVSPAAAYPSTFLVYTYGKTLLTPGLRLGYVALPPSMPDVEEVREALTLSMVTLGWAYANALAQHALPSIEDLSIDVAHLERKRDRMVAGLREAGYELHVPDGTFYLLPASPWADDGAFTDLLASKDVFVLPGEMVEWPGHFRISLTASDEMIDRALPRFAEAFAEPRAADLPRTRTGMG